ncbi:PucR family transcriptional regulator ligand-binding domain-containing protein [Bifidobacterium aquikefiricola]|uniref:PucR family transcriptional regulator n=1 Tax=Bifidobacterium aquikefiricola TaxID=3059038 RepID=A0AB39U4Y2_9BIFI
MTISLRGLLNQSDLHLKVVVSGHPDSVDAPISWVHSTELADPTPYLEGGELILLTGLAMNDREADEDQRQYARRLVQTGVRGIGFGVGVKHQQVPEWLVEQCERYGLPLFSVPRPTPFIAITKVVSRKLTDERQRGFTRSYHDQRQLMRAVHSLYPVSSIVSKLAEIVGGWVALINPAGTVIESSHRFLPVQISTLGDALTFSVLGEAKFMNVKGYDVAVFHIASPIGDTLGYLVAGRKGPTGSLNHTPVAAAVSLLSLAISRSTDANRVLSRLRAAMVRRCLEGRANQVRPYAHDLWDGMPAEPLRVIRLVGDMSALEAAQRLVEPFRKSLVKNLNPVVFGMVEDDAWVIVSQSNAAEWVNQLSKDSGVVLGISSGSTWSDMARARHEAYQAAAEAKTTGVAALQYGQGGAAGALENLVEPSLLRAFADLRLAPLRNVTFNLSTGPHADRIESSDSEGSGADTMTLKAIDVLRAWIDARGKMEEAARALDIHRHTMSKYVTHISRLLSADLKDPGTIAELWFACRYARPDRN